MKPVRRAGPPTSFAGRPVSHVKIVSKGESAQPAGDAISHGQRAPQNRPAQMAANDARIYALRRKPDAPRSLRAYSALTDAAMQPSIQRRVRHNPTEKGSQP